MKLCRRLGLGLLAVTLAVSPEKIMSYRPTADDAYTVLLTAVPAIPTVLIFTVSLVALLYFRLEVVWIIPSAGLLGYLLF